MADLAKLTKIPAAAYLRCSTDKQEMSLPSQRKAILDYAAKNGFKVVRWFEDEGKSGTRVQGRPGFQELLRMVQEPAKDFEAILVYDIDRWGRFIDPDEATHHRFVCKDNGAPVIFIVDGAFINQNNLGSRVFLTVKQEVATEESRKKSDIVWERSKLNAERGFSSGGFPPFGYDRELCDGDGNRIRTMQPGDKASKTQKVRWVPGLAREVALVQRIFKMRAEGKMGLKAIAGELNAEGLKTMTGKAWTSSTVRAMLKNPTYIGVRVYNKVARGKFRTTKIKTRPRDEWILAENQHPPLVDKKTWDQVQASFDNPRSRGRKPIVGEYLLPGLIYCQECGHTFHGKPQKGESGKRWFYYVDGGYGAGGNGNCSAFYIPRDLFESEVIGIIRRVMLKGFDSDTFVKRIERAIRRRGQNADGEVKKIDKELRENRKALDNLLAALERGTDFDLVHPRIQKLRQAQERLQAEREKVMHQSTGDDTTREQAARLIEQLRDFDQILRFGTIQRRQNIIKRIVERIEISKKAMQAKVHIRRIPIEDNNIEELLERGTYQKGECRRPDSNRHGSDVPRDFKSLVSTYSTTPAGSKSK